MVVGRRGDCPRSRKSLDYRESTRFQLERAMREREGEGQGRDNSIGIQQHEQAVVQQSTADEVDTRQLCRERVGRTTQFGT